VQAALRRAEAMAEVERKQRDAIDAELRTQRLTSVDLRARLDQQVRISPCQNYEELAKQHT
jgi:hypothetical protein